MRVSSQSLQQQFLSTLAKQQLELSRTQMQVATGKRVLTPADDPIAAAHMLDLDTARNALEQDQRSAQLGMQQLGLEEAALESAGNILQRVRELAVKAGNASETGETRQAIAREIRQLSDELLRVANTQDGRGDYLFGGHSNQARPFERTAAGVIYQGDQGQRLAKVAEGLTVAVTDPGDRIFMGAREGNGRFVIEADAANTGTAVAGQSTVLDSVAWGRAALELRFTGPDSYEVYNGSGALLESGSYAPGETLSFQGVQVGLVGQPLAGDSFTVSPSRHENVFDVLDGLATALEAPVDGSSSRARLNNGVNRALESLDQGLGQLLEVRADVGARLKAMDNQVALNEENALLLETALSEVGDLDYAEALGRLSLQMTGLEAAQQSFVRLQGLSLFNFLR